MKERGPALSGLQSEPAERQTTGKKGEAPAEPELGIGRPRRKWSAIVRNHTIGVISLAVLLGVVAISLAAPLLAPHNPENVDLASRLIPPFWVDGGSSEFLLGTDQLGRDTLSRLLYAGRWSLLAGFGATLAAATIGVTLGLIGGYFGQVASQVVNFLTNVTMGFPFVVFAIAVLAFVGRNFGVLLAVMAIGGWPVYGRLIQAEASRLQKSEFVMAAVAMGARRSRVVIRHLLPNLLDQVLALASVQVAVMVLSESFLSFLGFGVQPPAASWGSILSDGRSYLLDQWWLATFPGVAIWITTLSATLTGDLASAMFDPHYLAPPVPAKRHQR